MALDTKKLANRTVSRALDVAGFSSPRQSTSKRAVWSWLQSRTNHPSARYLRGVAVTYAPTGRVELQALDVPTAGMNEVSVLTEISALSPGTERAQYLGLPTARVDVGHRPGYALAGRVIRTGPGVHDLNVGDRVVSLGTGHQSVATVDRSRVVPVEGLSVEVASLLHVAIIGQHGADRAGPAPGTAILVMGAGLVGAMAALSAAARGATVHVTAKSTAKESAYRRLPVSFVSPDEADRTEYERVIDVSGDPDALAHAVERTRSGGTVVLLGSPRADQASLPLVRAQARGVRLVGAHVSAIPLGSPQHAETTARAVEVLSGAGTSDLVTDVVDAQGPDVAYRQIADSRHSVGVVLDWRALSPATRCRVALITSPPPDAGARGVDEQDPPLAWDGHRDGMAFPPTAQRPALRLGMVGCGEIAVATAEAALRLDQVSVVATHDPVGRLAADLARRTGAHAMDQLDDLLLRDDVDTVLLSVPHHLHAPLFRRAAEAGKNVIVEKPLANDLAGAAQVLDVAAAHPEQVFAIAFPQRYAPAVRAAHQDMRAGALGPLRGGHLLWLKDKPPSYAAGGYTGRTTSTWRQSRERAGGGVLIMNLCHYFDVLWHLTGEEAAVIHARTDDPGRTGLEQGVSMIVTLASGASVTVAASAAAPGAGTDELRLWGDHGHVVISREARVVTYRGIDGRQAGRWHELPTRSSLPERARFLADFAVAVAGGPQRTATLMDGYRNQALVAAAYESAATGRAVEPVRWSPGT